MHNDELPIESHVELEDNSNYYATCISKTLVYMTIHARQRTAYLEKHSPPEMTYGAARLRFSANSALLV